MNEIDTSISKKELELLNSKKGILSLLDDKKLNIEKAMRYVKYEKKLAKLQVKLLKLQQWVVLNKKKVIVICEGRDAAGKGGAIRRMVEHLPPREVRVVALPKPDEVERGQWYFQRYINHFPKEGEMVFFDRSWYNRAVVEPVNQFCTSKQYTVFMDQVNQVEKMMQESGTYLLKIYFSISKSEQQRRFKDMVSSPIKKWKYSAVDKKALELWDEYTKYRDAMFQKTQEHVPWKIIKANRKTSARIEAVEYVLNSIPYKVQDLEKRNQSIS